MRTLGAIALIAGVCWLDRRTLTDGLIGVIDRKRSLPAEQVAARGRLLKWLASLPAWPGAVLITIGGIAIWVI